MKKTILIKQGHVIDPANKIDEVLDILIKEGKIAEVGKDIKENAEQTIDAEGLIVTPGFIDLHVHLREPGREDKETIETGLRAALAGGVTSVVTMPNTTPITDSQSMVEFQIKRARELDLANLFPAGAITKGEAGEELSHIWEMKNSGIVAISDDGTDIQNEGLMKRSLEYAKTFDLVSINHCEITDLSEDGVMHEGKISTRLGLPGIPAVAEELAVAKVLMLAEYVGTRVHISHVSTGRTVELIKEYQKRGIKVTADTCPHYISLTDEECLDYNTYAKIYPPLRPQKDVDAVIDGIKEGIISVIATDHAPHLEFEKLQSFTAAQRGTVGLETSFAVANTFLVKTKKLSLEKLIEIMTVNPANVINVQKGTLSIDADADVTIIDPNKTWTADITKMETKGRNSVFNGMELTGKIQHVFVGGVEKVHDEKVL